MNKWRKEFVATCGRLGVPNALRDRLLREAPAIQRGAEAECSFIEEIAAPFVKRAAAAERRIRATLAATQPQRQDDGSMLHFNVETGGDPRGATLKLRLLRWPLGVVASPEVREFGVPAAGFSVAAMEWLERRQEAIWRREAAARKAVSV